MNVKIPELLAPAGSPEGVRAAVQSGAGAVYMGFGTFNARRNAQGFSHEEMADAIAYCRARNVKSNITLNILVGDRELDDALEEMSILWNDDLPYIVMMILRTLSNLRPSHTDLKVPPKFKSAEDPEFVKTLFEKTLVNYDSYQDYIERYTSNWDVERIVFMDNLILATAMAELISFPSIPVKVTLDEWIEISKYYSTPGSSTFINGVLDKIVESLTAEGRIRKAGRGLI